MFILPVLHSLRLKLPAFLVAVVSDSGFSEQTFVTVPPLRTPTGKRMTVRARAPSPRLLL